MNVSYLKGEIMDKMEEKLNGMIEDTTFFYKLRNMARFYKVEVHISERVVILTPMNSVS